MRPCIREDFNKFAQAIERRLEIGAVEYGDATLSRSAGEITSEIEEELADVCGWAFFLWLRIREIGKEAQCKKSI